MSFRMDAWNESTGALRNNYLLNSTGINYCNGGSDVAQILNTVFSMGTTIAMGAAAAKAQGANATQAAMTQATSNVTAGIQGYTAAKTEYDIANKELSALKERKANSSDDNIKKIEGEISSLKEAYMGKADSPNQVNQDIQNQYTALQTTISNLESASKKLADLNSVITSNQALANSSAGNTIGSSGISVGYTNEAGHDAGLAAKTLEGHNDDDRYNKSNPNFKEGGTEPPIIFMQSMFEADMQAARAMDSKQQDIIAAKNAVSRAEQEKATLATTFKLPEGTTAENIDSKLQEAKQTLTGLGNENMKGSGVEAGKNMSFAQYNAKLETLEKQLEDAKADKTDGKSLDEEISAKTKEVSSKKTKMELKKTELIKIRSGLESQITEMQSLSSDAGVKLAKGEYKAAKKEDNANRSFLRRIFGSKKGQDVKDAKTAYQNVKANHNAANQAFTETHGYSANASSIAMIQSQIDMIDRALKPE